MSTVNLTLQPPSHNRSMLTLQTPEYVVKLTLEQWKEFIGGEPRDVRGELETSGPWHIPVGFRALAVSRVYSSSIRSFPEQIILYGRRKMSEITQDSYELFGRVSIDGKKRKAFTSSVMFDVNGKLCEVGVIHVCSN